MLILTQFFSGVFGSSFSVLECRFPKVRFNKPKELKRALEKHQMIFQNILKDMKKNAVLFYLDHDARGDMNELKKQVVKTQSFKEIKSSEFPEKYALQHSTKAYHQKSYDFLSPLNECCFVSNEPVTFSSYIKNPHVKIQLVEKKKTITVTGTPCQDPEDPDKFYRPKKSSNTKRGSNETFRLVGKFALKDMEKKYKDDSSRQEAKKAAVSRHADFDDW